MDFKIRSDEPRLKMGPWRTMATMAGALVLGALLNADALATTASSQVPGWKRTVAVAASDLLVDVSDALLLDEPHQALTELLDRNGVDEADPVAPLPGEVFVPTGSQPLRVWAVGDSLVETIGAAVVNAGSELGVVEGRFDVQYSSGLTRPELYDWPGRLAAELARQPTDIVVFMVGANDGQAIETPSGFEAFGTAAWQDEYRTRVHEAMDVLEEHAIGVYWIGLPVAADERLSARFAVMNGVFRSEAAMRTDVHFIDIYGEFSAADGAYVAHLPDANGNTIRIRDQDGIHFTPEGAEFVAAVVFDEIAAVWSLSG
jgi:hypothetical protein